MAALFKQKQQLQSFSPLQTHLQNHMISKTIGNNQNINLQDSVSSSNVLTNYLQKISSNDVTTKSEFSNIAGNSIEEEKNNFHESSPPLSSSSAFLSSPINLKKSEENEINDNKESPLQEGENEEDFAN